MRGRYSAPAAKAIICFPLIKLVRAVRLLEITAHNTQVKVSVDPGIAAEFKAACMAKQASMASVLSQYMAKYSNAAAKSKPDLLTRRQRRAAIQTIIQRLEQIITAEERYRDNVPENLQGSAVTERADNLISSVEEALEILGSVE